MVCFAGRSILVYLWTSRGLAQRLCSPSSWTRRVESVSPLAPLRCRTTTFCSGGRAGGRAVAGKTRGGRTKRFERRETGRISGWGWEASFVLVRRSLDKYSLPFMPRKFTMANVSHTINGGICGLRTISADDTRGNQDHEQSLPGQAPSLFSLPCPVVCFTRTKLYVLRDEVVREEQTGSRGWFPSTNAMECRTTPLVSRCVRHVNTTLLSCQKHGLDLQTNVCPLTRWPPHGTTGRQEGSRAKRSLKQRRQRGFSTYTKERAMRWFSYGNARQINSSKKEHHRAQSESICHQDNLFLTLTWFELSVQILHYQMWNMPLYTNGGVCGTTSEMNLRHTLPNHEG